MLLGQHLRPPRRAKLATKPEPMGSATPANTGPTPLSSPFIVNKIPISAAIEGPGAQDMVALVLRRTVGLIRASHPHTGGKRRWRC
jgi:hypothetical protein